MKYIPDTVLPLVKKGCIEEYNYIKHLYPNEKLIKFEFFSEDDQISFGINAVSNEERIRQKVKDKEVDRIWFEVAFDPPQNDELKSLNEVYDILEAIPIDEFDDDEFVDMLEEFHDVCLVALEELRNEGFFKDEGLAGDSSDFILNFVISCELSIEVLRRLNPDFDQWQKRHKSRYIKKIS